MRTFLYIVGAIAAVALLTLVGLTAWKVWQAPTVVEATPPMAPAPQVIEVIVKMPDQGASAPEVQQQPMEANTGTSRATGVSNEEPTVTLMTSSRETFTYNVGEDSSIWMSQDEGLEKLKLEGGVVALHIPEGWQARVFASAGSISCADGTKGNLGNPATCGGSEVFGPGLYFFSTFPHNDSAGIKADVWQSQSN